MRNLGYILGIGILLATTSCEYAQSNVKTLVTNDCGVSWSEIPAGQSIPSKLTACRYTITIPDYPMQGTANFKSNFKDRVRADMEVSYDYIITDGSKFIQSAKYLGRKSSESDEAAADKKFESAENLVIDTRIKEIARQLLPSEDIVDFDESDFEVALLAKVNDMLAPRGVQLQFLSVVSDPSEQTKQAIDVATAMKIYKAKDLDEVGRTVVTAKAGASRVNVNVSPGTKPEDDDEKDSK